MRCHRALRVWLCCVPRGRKSKASCGARQRASRRARVRSVSTSSGRWFPCFPGVMCKDCQQRRVFVRVERVRCARVVGLVESKMVLPSLSPCRECAASLLSSSASVLVQMSSRLPLPRSSLQDLHRLVH